MNEQFSAFLDNETTRDECDAVINALLRDEALRDSWTRQHQIRDALRASAGEPGVAVDLRFSARVMQAIRDDSAPAAERMAGWQRDVNVDSPKVASMSRKRRRGYRWRNMAGLAVAASAAGVALFATQPLQQLKTVPDAPTTQAMQTATQTASTVAVADTTAMPDLHFENTAGADEGAGGFGTPWQLASGFVRNVAARVDQAQDAVDHWSVSNPALANRLNDLLVEHNGVARGYGLGATTPAFVRVATYGEGIAQ